VLGWKVSLGPVLIFYFFLLLFFFWNSAGVLKKFYYSDLKEFEADHLWSFESVLRN
jgi:hypothetical protein